MSNKIYIVKDFESRPDDKRCLAGTKKALCEAFASKFEWSMEIHEVEKLPKDKDTLYWVEFDRENWAGSGGGSSQLFVNLNEVKDWIKKQLDEWNVDIGEVKYSIYPVYIVTKKDEGKTVDSKKSYPHDCKCEKKECGCVGRNNT